VRAIAAIVLAGLVGGGAVVAAAGGGPRAAGTTAATASEAVTVDAIGDQVQTRRAGALPVFAETGEAATLYRFAKERGDVLQWIPCTCGCATLGHTSNRSCYIKAEGGDRTTWTSHAAT
jgi:hypothetical protein